MPTEGITSLKLSDYYVQPLEKEKALKTLKTRLADGEDPYKITKISDKYYRDKIIAGLCPISALIYSRIMMELPLPRPESEPMHCLRCGAIIKGNGIYCSVCNNKYKSDKKTEVSVTSLPYIRHKTKKGSYICDE